MDWTRPARGSIRGTAPLDSDLDGVPDIQDVDSNGDGIAETPFAWLDADGDGRIDYRDPDSDNDGLADAVEGGDANGDGINDRLQKLPEREDRPASSPGGSVGWLGLLLLLAAYASRGRRERVPTAGGLAISKPVGMSFRPPPGQRRGEHRVIP